MLGLSRRQVRRDPGRSETGWRGEELWGDPFASDDWTTLLNTRSWELCSSDEFLCLFPRLVGVTPVPPPLLRHMRGSVERLSLNSDSRGALPEPPCASDRQASNQKSFAFVRRLSETVSAFEQGQCPNFSSDLSAEVAFWTGVHPAYLWPEALVLHEMLSAIGWLGICLGGRDAMLPLSIAEYFVDVVRVERGRYEVSEPLLARYLRSDAFVGCLLIAAEKRLSEHKGVVVPGQPTHLHLAEALH